MKKAMILIALVVLFSTQAEARSINGLSTSEKSRIYIKATNYPSGSRMEEQAIQEIMRDYGLRRRQVLQILGQYLGAR